MNELTKQVPEVHHTSLLQLFMTFPFHTQGVQTVNQPKQSYDT